MRRQGATLSDADFLARFDAANVWHALLLLSCGCVTHGTSTRDEKRGKADTPFPSVYEHETRALMCSAVPSRAAMAHLSLTPLERPFATDDKEKKKKVCGFFFEEIEEIEEIKALLRFSVGLSSRNASA